MVSWFKSAMEESEKYIKAMSDCIPEIKDKSKPMSNADRIRSMSDEELADFIDYNEVDCAKFCQDYKAGCSWTCKHNQGKDFLLKWLQSEAE